MAYPTPAQIDAAVPVGGKPSRALTNTALKNIVGAASYLPADGSVPTRSVANENFSGGRLKATPATDPDDCITKVQLDNWQVAPTNWGPFNSADLDPLTMWIPGAMVNGDSTGAQQGYFSMSVQPAQKAIAMRDGDGALAVSPATAPEHAVTKSQLDESAVGSMRRAAAQPDLPTSPGVTGQWWADGENFFICIAPNTWRVSSLVTWSE